MADPPRVLETSLQITKQLRACQTIHFLHFFRTLLVRGCPDTKVVWMWFGYGMPDRVEPDETDATQTCKEKIIDLVRGLTSPRDRDVILLWPRLSMPD
jgi:hypothetical protein